MAAGNSSYRAARGEYALDAPQKSASAGKVAVSMKATALTVGLVLLSRILGVVRNILLGHIFGQTPETDQYWAAFGVPDLIALVIAGGGLSAVFIPVFAKYWNDKQEEEAWHVFGTIMCVVMAVIAVLVAGMELGVHPLTHLLNNKFDPSAVARTAQFSRILLPAQWFLIVGGFMMGTLNARKRFLEPNLGPVLYNAGTIVGALTQWHKPHPDMIWMAWGTLVGAFLGSFLLQLVTLIRVGVVWRPGFDFGHPGVRRVGELMLPVLLGLSLNQLIMWVTQRCLPDDNRITAMKNAYDLTQAPIGIFAQAFGIVLLPTISILAAKMDWTEYRRTIDHGIRQVLFLTIPASLLMSALALPLVRVIYVHGKFTEANGETCATALLCYSLGTFAWSSLAILARGFTARQEMWTPIKITTPMIFLFAILVKIALWIDPDGVAGPALAATLVGIATMLLFLHYLQKSVGRFAMHNLLNSIIRTAIAALFSAAAAYGVAYLMETFLGHGKMASIGTVVIAGGVGVGLYLGISVTVLPSKELKDVRQLLRKRQG